MSCFDPGEENSGLVQFHCTSFVSQQFRFKVLSQSSCLCWNSRGGKSCRRVGFGIPANLHVPQLCKTCLLLGSTVFVSTNEAFCSRQRGNTSVTVENLGQAFSTVLFWTAVSKCSIQNAGNAEKAFPKEQTQEVCSARGSLTVQLI